MEVPVKGVICYRRRDNDPGYNAFIQMIKGRAYQHGIEVKIDKDITTRLDDSDDAASKMETFIQASGYAAIVIDDAFWGSASCRHEVQLVMACGLAVDLFVKNDVNVNLKADQCADSSSTGSCAHTKCAFYSWFLSYYGDKSRYYLLTEAATYNPRTYQYTQGVDRAFGDRVSEPCYSLADAQQVASTLRSCDTAIIHYREDGFNLWWKDSGSTNRDTHVHSVYQFTPLVIRGVDMPGGDLFDTEVSSVHEARYELNKFRMKHAAQDDPRMYWGYYRHGHMWIKKVGTLGPSSQHPFIMILT